MRYCYADDSAVCYVADDRQLDSLTTSVVTLPLHQPAIASMPLPLATEAEPMDLSEKSTTSITNDVCLPSLAVATLDQDRGGGGLRVEDQLHSPAGSVSSSAASRDGSDATSVMGAVSGVEPSDLAKSQNKVRQTFS